MFNFKFYASFFLGLILVSSDAHSQDVYKSSDVVGVFADVGYLGRLASTKTITQAHLTCTLESGRTDTEVDTNYNPEDSDYYNSYKGCMSDYVPFRVTGSGISGSCTSEIVKWGNCSAKTTPLSEGAVYSVKNSTGTKDFEGFASFQCVGGRLTFQGGGCSATVKSCKSGLVTSWGVSSPSWADELVSTAFTDRYGQVRHTPKAGCFASMPEALSGKLVVTLPTVPEMMEPKRYEMAISSSPKRCFNGEWMSDFTAGKERCEYVPKQCKPKIYTNTKGCGFALPLGNHDEVFIGKNPSPQNSIGNIQAFCWDGDWEVKSAACQLSCAQTIPAYEWSAIDPVACSHDSKSYSARIPPNTNTILKNGIEGMVGSASYFCKDGVIESKGESCTPKSCEGVIPANVWSAGSNSCSHIKVVSAGNNYAHNDVLKIDSSGGVLAETVGSVKYSCAYGVLKQSDTFCGGNVGPEICYSGEVIAGGTGSGSSGPTPAPGDVNVCTGSGATYENGMCCYVSGPYSNDDDVNHTGEKRCFMVR
jgi:hypothetical protein